MKVGHRYCIPWKRSISSEAASLRGESSIPMNQWPVTTHAKRDECIAVDKSTIRIPEKFVTGTDILGYIFLRDANENVQQGNDDRDKIKVQVDGIETTLGLLQNAYSICAAKLL